MKTRRKRVTLIIPTYNEGNTINRALSFLESGIEIDGIKISRIIFVDDGSTDDTVRLIRAKKASIARKLKNKVSVISYKKNRGRGYAVRTAAMRANTEYILYTDADFSVPLYNLTACLPYMDKQYDLVFGSKKKPGAVETIHRSQLRRTIGYGHTVVASLTLGTFAWDFQGGFKLFSRQFVRDVFPTLLIDRWGFDMEVIFLGFKLGFKTAEIPVVWSHSDAKSKVKLVRDIFLSLQEMLLIRYNWLMGRYETKKLKWSGSVIPQFRKI